MLRVVLLTAGVGLCLLGGTACSGTSNAVATPNAAGLARQLPAPAGLDARRTASASQEPLDVTQPLLASQASVSGAALDLAAPAGQLAYAIFRLAPPVTAVVSITAGGDDGLYLLVADFTTGRWERATPLSAGFAVAALSTLGQPLSPAGFVYCAVVAPPVTAGQLSSLALDYDGPAHIYYVATPGDGGSDANPGTAAAPWATLQHAADNVVPDSLVMVRAGSYLPFLLLTSGASGAPIIFHAEPGVVVDSTGVNYALDLQSVSWVTLEGFTIQDADGYAIFCRESPVKAQHVTLRNNDCHDCRFGAITVAFTDYVLVEGNTCEGAMLGDALVVGYDSDHAVVRHNTVHGNAGNGIDFIDGAVNGGDNSLDDELITANTCFANGTSTMEAGLAADGLTNSTLCNNLLYANGIGASLTAAYGSPCTDDVVAHNTIVQDAASGDCVSIADGCTGMRLFNNILFCANSSQSALKINSPSLPGFLADCNVLSDDILLDGAHHTLAQWQSATLRDGHSLVSLPALTFRDPLAPDYHLLLMASAVDLALPAYSPADDLDWIARPQGPAPDCGCYELVP